MRVLTTTVLTFSLGLVFAHANQKDSDATTIGIILEGRKEIIPDILRMTIEINAVESKESEVINILGSLDKTIRGLNLSYSGGSYSVYKNCWWDKDKRKCIGYKGDITYNFSLKDVKEQNKILDILDDFKEKYGEKLNYSISRPQWIVSEKNLKTSESEVKLEMIDIAVDFGKKAGEKLNKNCSIYRMNYEVRQPFWEYIPVYKSTLAIEKSNIEAPEPKKEDKAISVKVNVEFKCR